MKGFRPEQVINGTWGEVWFDGEYLAQVTACKAEVTLKKTAISQCQNLVDGQKVTGLEPKGELKLHKINSFVMNKVNKVVKAGKTPTHTIISNVNDPDAIGAERVVLQTPRYRYYVYTWDYGNEFEDLIGQGYTEEYIEAETQRMTEDCLSVNENIQGISDFSVSMENDVLTVSFVVNTIYGDIEFKDQQIAKPTAA